MKRKGYTDNASHHKIPYSDRFQRASTETDRDSAIIVAVGKKLIVE